MKSYTSSVRRGRPPPKRPIRLAALAIAACAVVGHAGAIEAQEPEVSREASATRLTLEQALGLAEHHNPGFRRTTTSLELNAIEAREAWLQLLPRPQLSVLNTSMSWNLQHVGTDPFGNPLPNPEAHTVQSSQSRQQAGLSFGFDVGDYMGFRNRGHNAEAREVSAAQHLHELRGDVRRTFLEAQQQQVMVALEEELLERQRENREIAGRLFALAQRQRIDVLEADLDVAIQEGQLRQTRATLSAVLLQLGNLIGDPDLELAGVVPAPFEAVDPERFDDDALVGLALRTNPVIELQQAVIRQTERQLTEMRWEQWLPTFSFGLNMSRTELERDGGGAFFQPLPESGWDRNITVQVSFPDLGRRFENRTAAHRERIELRNADEMLRERQLQVEQSVRTSLLDLRTAHHSVALQEQRVSLAEERLEERLEAYRLGRGNYQDLQTATEGLAAAERALLTARHQLEGALVSLEQALGTPVALPAAAPGDGS